MNTIVETVTATDGTSIALERIGTGAPVIPVGGAFNDRSTVAANAGIPRRVGMVRLLG